MLFKIVFAIGQFSVKHRSIPTGTNVSLLPIKLIQVHLNTAQQSNYNKFEVSLDDSFISLFHTNLYHKCFCICINVFKRMIKTTDISIFRNKINELK